MTQPDVGGGTRLRRRAGQPRRGRAVAHGPRHVRRRHLAAGHAARVLRAQPPRPRRDPSDRHLRRARAAGRARGVHRGRPEPRRQGAVAHVHRPAEPGDAAPAAGRGARCASSATRSRSSSPRAARSRRTRPTSSRSTTSPCPRSSTTPTPKHATVLVHEQHGSNVIGELAGLPASALDDVFAAAAHVTTETIYQQAYAAAPMEGRGLIVDYSRATGDLTIYAATQSPHEVRLFCSRLLGHARAPHPGRDARHRRRLRAEGHGAARRDVPDARGARRSARR